MINASLVTFHTPLPELERLIKCILASSINIMYVVDNSSNDSLRSISEIDKRIKYIHSENLGYGTGHNIAIKYSLETGAKYHVVLNPDVYWSGDVIGTLSDYMESNDDVGLVMPKIIYPDGNIQYLCKLLPTPFDLIGRRFFPLKSAIAKLDYKYELQWTGYDETMEVPSLSGCFMFLRCSILKQTGAFDQRYFMYAEDLDLCRRIGEVSKTVYYPKAIVVHQYEKGSYKNRKLLRYHIKSIIKYFNKWGWFFDKKRTKINNHCLKNLPRLS